MMSVVPRVHLWHIADNKKSATSTTINITKGSVASVDSSGLSGSLVTVMFIKNSVFGFVEIKWIDLKFHLYFLTYHAKIMPCDRIATCPECSCLAPLPTSLPKWGNWLRKWLEKLYIICIMAHRLTTNGSIISTKVAVLCSKSHTLHRLHAPWLKKMWSVIAITAFIWAKVQMALLGYLRRWTASDHKGFFVLQKTLYHWSCFFIKKFILLASTVCHVLFLKVISTRLVDIKWTERQSVAQMEWLE